EAKKAAEEAKRLEEARKAEEAKRLEEERQKDLQRPHFYNPKYLFAKDIQHFPEICDEARLEILSQLTSAISQAAAHDNWHHVKELAIQMKDYDQALSTHWQNKAETQLGPSIHVTAWLDGREVSATFLNKERQMTPLHLTGLVPGVSYSGELEYERNGETFGGKINFKVDWKGEKEYRIFLKSTVPSMNLTLPDGTTIPMVEIEAGEFMMGEDNGSSDEQSHKVTLTQNFWMGRYEITQKQWKAVMDNNPSNFKFDENPVEGITWNEATKFCEKLNEMAADSIPDGFKVSLPTEAQWEFAARGGKRGKHFPYSGSDVIDDVAWHSENSNVRTQPVGMKFANELGLYDMTGNVWEWCLDACEWENKVLTDTYRDGIVDPISTKGELHIIRGGGWLSSPKNCRIANRLCCDTNFKIYNLGLRIVLVPKK
ncbi:MAG: SUMF1/EgtB/PvdO family nonheme iron enzyme, partial [Victivallales bacterium]|nr:SUMF1/EgtB/PvdO family nonheme iron enzyme [Victivallales bacterium]